MYLSTPLRCTALSHAGRRHVACERRHLAPHTPTCCIPFSPQRVPRTITPIIIAIAIPLTQTNTIYGRRRKYTQPLQPLQPLRLEPPRFKYSVHVSPSRHPACALVESWRRWPAVCAGCQTLDCNRQQAASSSSVQLIYCPTHHPWTVPPKRNASLRRCAVSQARLFANLKPCPIFLASRPCLNFLLRLSSVLHFGHRSFRAYCDSGFATIIEPFEPWCCNHD